MPAEYTQILDGYTTTTGHACQNTFAASESSLHRYHRIGLSVTPYHRNLDPVGQPDISFAIVHHVTDQEIDHGT